MTPCTRCTAVIMLVLCMALPAWSQQYLLYTPQPVDSDQKPSPQDGILVQEIKIQKGDTLSGLSRKFSGKGRYYPQILLFNQIKNPNLIYTGNTLRIPLSQSNKKGAVQVAQSPSLEYPAVKVPTAHRPAARKKTSSAAPAANSSTAGQKQYESAVRSYREGDFRAALEQFDRFLADNSSSPLAADANLYKAECYLKLSTQ